MLIRSSTHTYVHAYIHVMIEYKIYSRVDLVNVMPELYIEVADPEIPSSKGVLSSLFGDSRHSVVNREELCKLVIYSNVHTCMIIMCA